MRLLLEHDEYAKSGIGPKYAPSDPFSGDVRDPGGKRSLR